MKNSFILLVAISISCYCATTGTQEDSLYGQSRIIKAGYDRIIKATVDYLSERGYNVKKVEMEKGDIETDYQPGVGFGTGFTGDKRAKVKAKVTRIDEGQSKLVLELFSEERDPQRGWQFVTPDYYTARTVYDRFFEAITARAQGQKIE
jgi:hypothetical protein